MGSDEEKKSNGQDLENLRLLYKENGHITRAYLEWRHKVMTRLFLTIAGTLLTSRWMYENPSLHKHMYIPFLLGALFSFFSALMDNVNGRILGDYYILGERLERKMDDGGGTYAITNKQYGHAITYTRILNFMYWGSGMALILVGCFVDW